jgi:hypothetical protein
MVTRKVTAPSVRRYRARRSAYRVLDKLNTVPEEQWTEEQRRSASWARSCIGEAVLGKKDLGSKRQRSTEEEEAGRLDAESKRVKLHAGQTQKGHKPVGAKLYSEVAKEGELVLAVVDDSNEDGSITGEKWSQVFNALNLHLFRILGEYPGPPPTCRNAGWHRRSVKLIACGDERSAFLLKKAIGEVGEVWPGAKLRVVPRAEIPSRPRAMVRLPLVPSGAEEIIKMLQVCNPNLPTGNWSIVKLEEAQASSRLAIMLINKESLAPLAKTKGVINFGFGAATLKVFKRDEGVEKGITSQPEEGRVDQPVETVGPGSRTPAEGVVSGIQTATPSGSLTEELRERLFLAGDKSDSEGDGVFSGFRDCGGSDTDETVHSPESG